MMKVGKLIEELQNYDEDMDVHILIQPNRWPLSYTVYDVTDAEDPTTHQTAVYIVEGKQLGYGPRDV